jgi:DNA polymerase
VATHGVPGEGNPEAEIMFIGEGPGQVEDEQGRPFVGPAGQLLNELMEKNGIKREEVWITNVIKHRAPGNRDPLPQEVEAYWPLLKEEIEIIQPKLIILLGRHALERFLPGMSISKVRGQPMRVGGQVFLPIYHPAVALHNPKFRSALEEDFAKIPRVLALIKEGKQFARAEKKEEKRSASTTTSSPQQGTLL